MASRLSECAYEIDRLDRLSRTRALTLPESLALERAINQHDRVSKATHPRWSGSDDRTAAELRSAGLSYGRISRRLNSRSKDAVAARLRYLRMKEAV